MLPGHDASSRCLSPSACRRLPCSATRPGVLCELALLAAVCDVQQPYRSSLQFSLTLVILIVHVVLILFAVHVSPSQSSSLCFASLFVLATPPRSSLRIFLLLLAILPPNLPCDLSPPFLAILFALAILPPCLSSFSLFQFSLFSRLAIIPLVPPFTRPRNRYVLSRVASLTIILLSTHK